MRKSLVSPVGLLAAYALLILASLPLTPTAVNALTRLGELQHAVAAAGITFAGTGFLYVRAKLAVRDWRFYALAFFLAAGAGAASLAVATAQERLHIPEYALMAILAGNALKKRFSRGKLFLFTFGAAAIFGVVDEGVQFFLPMRVCDIRDMAFNAEAAALGTAFFALYRRFTGRT